MAIRRHNRTIWILAGVVFLLLLAFLIREGKFSELAESEMATETPSSPTAPVDEFGDRVSESVPGDDSQKNYLRSLDLLGACFQMKGSSLVAPATLEIETLFRKFQEELGLVNHQSDHWMEWHLRLPDGRERRLRLEITENDEGQVGRELHYIQLSRDGQTHPTELSPEQSRNPTDDVINQLLREGEVFYKERAAAAFFPNGERVELVEKNGALSEIEFFKENRQFRCPDILNPETCQCI